MNDVQFGMNQYCGPAVLSIFTGLDTDVCAAEINKARSQFGAVKGVSSVDLIAAGKNLGLEFSPNEAFQNRSLFWTASALVNFPGKYLIVVPGHYITIEVQDNKQIFICDNHTKTPIDLKNSSRLSQKVERLWKVTKVFDYVLPEKPHEVSEIIETVEIAGGLSIRKIITMSDGGIKVRPLGTLLTTNLDDLKMISSQMIDIVRLKDDPNIF